MVNEKLTFGRVGSRPYGQLTITEMSTDPTLNQSVISIHLVLKRPYNIESTATKTATCTINGQTYDWVGIIGGRGDKVLISKTQIVPHNDDGSKTIFVSASITLEITWSGIWVGKIQGADAITLTKIPRTALVTQTLADRTETSLTINWSTNEVIDRLWYSSDNGSTWTQETITEGRVGSYVIENLTVGTEYNIKTKVRRKSNQLVSESSTMVASTYRYPYAELMPDFTIGVPLLLTIANPLNHTITVELIDSNNNSVKSQEATGSIVLGFNDTDTQNALYQSIPNSKRGQYKIRVTYNSHVSTNTGGYYEVNESQCSPSFGTVSYRDINQTVVAITQDDQKIVQNHSIVRYGITGMSAQKYASISSCSVLVNGNNYNLTITGASANGGDAAISSGVDTWAKFSLTDSRGITATTWKKITILKYKAPTAIITLKRQSNFYTDTDLKVNADYASINGHNAITITYRARKSGSSQYTVSGAVQDNVQSVIQLDNAYDWYVEVTLTDALGGTKTYTGLKVPKGIPIVFIDRKKSSFGINCFPTGTNSFELNGNEMSASATMTCTMDSDLNLLQTDTFTTISLPTFTTTNNSIFNSQSLPIGDKGIKVAESLKYIVVSASVSFFISPTSGERAIRIMCVQGGNISYFAEVARLTSVSGIDTLNILPFLLQLDPTSSNANIFLQYKTPGSLDSIKKSTTWLTAQTP